MLARGSTNLQQSFESKLRRSLRCLVLLCLVTCTACIPILPHQYYRPRAAGAETITDDCWRTRETIKFRIDGADVYVRLSGFTMDAGYVEMR